MQWSDSQTISKKWKIKRKIILKTKYSINFKIILYNFFNKLHGQNISNDFCIVPIGHSQFYKTLFPKQGQKSSTEL